MAYYNNVKDYISPSAILSGTLGIKEYDIPTVHTMTEDENERWRIQKNINYGIISSQAVRERWDELASISDNIDGNEKQDEINTPGIPQKPVIKKRKKFKIGEHYIIYPFKNKRLKREYVVKKTIYSINGEPVNILVMKQVKGDHLMKYTLNRTDCQKYHIKFEDGLEVYSMDLDWKLVKINKKK